jgi:hypothetical protein
MIALFEKKKETDYDIFVANVIEVNINRVYLPVLRTKRYNLGNS